MSYQIKQFEDAYGQDPGRSYFMSEDMVIAEDVSTERSPKVFAEMCLTTDVGEEDKLKDEYDYPRVKVGLIWEVYEEWCRINDIEPKSKYAGGKSDIAYALDVQKGPAKWPGVDEQVQCYYKTKLSDLGYWIKSKMD